MAKKWVPPPPPECPICKGSGSCISCDGSGNSKWKPGTNCGACNGSGSCRNCHGSGMK